MPHVLMIRPLHPDAVALLAARPDITYETLEPVTPEGLAEKIAAADGIAVRTTPIPAELIARGNRLQVVSRHGVGYDAVDVAALTARKIPLMVTSQANAVSVAEHALAMILAVAKRLVEQDAMMRAGGWGALPGRAMVDLAGRTALVIGFGRIGHRTAKYLQVLGLRTLVFDPYVDQAGITAAGHVAVGDLDAALAQAQVISIHCPKTPETTNLIDARRLKLLPLQAILVNTARGGIIDEAALAEALTTGSMLGAGIDVFEQEPTRKDNPLYALPNVLVSPHLAGVTAESLRRMGMACIQNILDVLDGKPDPANVINKEVL
jgi:D-3-phosphoglycerate dehydrogenase